MTAPQAETPSAYYSSADVATKYIESATAGLWELEQEAVNEYFADGSRVLDLGCGTGRTTRALVEQGHDVVGIDLSESFLEYAQSTVPDGEFILGDARRLPFEDGAFAHVLFSYNGIDDIVPEEERYRTFREIRRVLQPGGTVVFSSHNRWSTYVPSSVDTEGIRQLAEFWYENVRNGRLWSRYKLDNSGVGNGKLTYHIRPAAQQQQLKNCGFEPLAVLRTDGSLTQYFHHPYYVARKPIPSDRRPEPTYAAHKGDKRADS